jgi:hypothetical protein
MPDYNYPTSGELFQIEQDLLPRLEADRPIFQFFPIVTRDSPLVLWEQQDSYTGLQQIRGINGSPPKVAKVGVKRFQMEPGYYGEHIPIDEIELTLRRQYGTVMTPINIGDLVTDAQRQLLVRRLDRIESIGWTLATTGTFAVSAPFGAIAHQDSYTMQTFTAVVPWATIATATPLADFRAMQLLARGHSVRFDSTSRAYATSVTVNRLLSNTNPNDLGGRRGAGLTGINDLGQVNALWMNDNLPQIVPYDGGYLPDPIGTPFVTFIPDGVVVVVGRRTDGGAIAQYQMTRNAQNPDLSAGPYTKVIDRGEDQVPRAIEVHDGHNGGPAILFPSAFVRMNV